MNNDRLESMIVNKKAEAESAEIEQLKNMFADKEREFMNFENPIVRPLSEYSTTQLKAELRRRKGRRGNNG